MWRLALLFTCLVSVNEAQLQRPGFYLPFLINQQQLNQADQFFLRLRPFIRPLNPLRNRLPNLDGIGLSDTSSPFQALIRLPSLFNQGRFRLPPAAYYVLPANALPGAQESITTDATRLFPPPTASQIDGRVPIGSEDESQCQHEQEYLPYQMDGDQQKSENFPF